MATKFTHHLHVIVYSKALAEQLSKEFYAAFPEVGPNNVSCELVASDADDAATATAWESSAPVKLEYITWMDNLIKQLPPQAKSLIRWWRKDRNNNVERRHDNDKPAKQKFTDADGRSEVGLKLRKPRIDDASRM